MHEPVLLHEMIDLLAIKEDGAYVDGTAGGGGHAAALLQRLGEHGRLLAVDRDPDAVTRVRARFAASDQRVAVVHGNYAELPALAVAQGLDACDGVLLDLGVSSFQLDEGPRGFSFRHDGPLDMRMDTTRGPTAAALVNELDEPALADMIWRLGEERDARRIAAAIIKARAARTFETTGQLAEVVRQAKGPRAGARIDPATKTFQALRMAVNTELESLQQGLESAIHLLRPMGRLAVISFHSLEDRLVKHALAAHVGREESLPQGGSRWVGVQPACRWVTRKAVKPSDSECALNPRARSAKLRVVERLP